MGRRIAGRLADTTSAGEVASAVRRPDTDRLRVRTRRSDGRRVAEERSVEAVLLVLRTDGWLTQGLTRTLDGLLNGLVTVVGQGSVTIVALEECGKYSVTVTTELRQVELQVELG